MKKICYLFQFIFFHVLYWEFLFNREKVYFYTEKRTGREIVDGVPMISYIQMGLKESTETKMAGWYDGSVVDIYLNSGEDTKKASETSMNILNGILNDFYNHPSKLFKLLGEKICTTWLEPTFQTIWINEPAEYFEQAPESMKNNKLLIVKILITTIIQFLIYYSVTYWTYRALGFSEYGLFKIISMQSILFATVSGIPSPGSVGVTEGAFTEIFRNVYPSEVMSTAVLLSRGINFYLFVLISGIATIINHARSSKKIN